MKRKKRLMARNVLTRYLVIGLLAIFASGVLADTIVLDSGNTIETVAPSQISGLAASVSSTSGSVPLGFNPDNYRFVIYDCGSKDNQIGDLTDIVEAMKELFGEDKYLGDNFTYRSGIENPVTIQDLTDPETKHDILIVGWNANGDTSGLFKTVIEAGITGRAVISGHDADYHTAVAAGGHDSGDFQPADMFFSQAMEYVLAGNGTGLIALGDTTENGFSWLPESWNISTEELEGSTENIGEIVTKFTPEGIASGIFDGLEPSHMAYWGQSYHNAFASWSTGFAPFELNETFDEVVTIAADINPYELVELSKDSVIIDNDGTGTECCNPGDDIQYVICWDNILNKTFENVTIVDYLPYGVDYDFAIDPFNPDPNYNILNHSYTWSIDTIDPNNDSGCVSLTVTVNEHAEAGMFLHNIAHIYSGDTLIGIATNDTPVCCWQTEDADLILVDKNAVGFNTGTSWEHAYTDLQDALKRAREAGCSTTGYRIYVAEGSYSPGNLTADNFELPYETKLYGGFKTGGCDFEERNPNKYKTILTGAIDGTHKNEIIVNLGNNSILDGFIVEFADTYAVYGQNINCEVNNCDVLKSEHGLYFENGNIILNWNKVRYNEKQGIYHSGSGNDLVISHCFSSFNGNHGILALNSNLTLTNSVITRNGNDVSFGIGIFDPNEPPVLYNNTIAYNYNMGLSYVQSDPNAMEPEVNGCILYYNNENNEQMSGIEYPEFCCIQDSINDPNGLYYTEYDIFGNISGKPMFAYLGDPNNIHLAHNSLLIDRGDSDLTSTEVGSVDIDNETRIDDYWLDIGADEVNTCDGDLTEDDIYNIRDWNNDGIVNLKEFSLMSAAWLTNSPDTPSYVADPNNYDPNFVDNWNEQCNLYVDYTIDISDFELFTDQWLWQACWKVSQDSRFDYVATASTMSLSLDSTASIASAEQISIDDQEERENIAMLVLGIYQIIDIMENSKYNTSSEFDFDDVDAEIDKLEEILDDMYNDYYSIDTKFKKYKNK